MTKRIRNLNLFCFIFGLFGSAALPLSSAAANVTLAWDANSETNLVGYRLYYGTAPRAYSGTVKVGAAATTATVSNLTPGQTFYFAVSATNAAGLESSYSSEVAYTVAAVSTNMAPVANAQSVTTAEDTAKAITLTGSDANGNPLTYTVVTAPTKGALSGTAPNLTYSPAANFNGSDSFTFRVNDGQTNSAAATVAITVTPVNDAPVASAQSVSTLKDTATAITLSGTDVEGSPLTYAIVSQPANGTLSGTAPNVIYNPASGYTGADSFTFRANDGTANSAVATVSINVKNGNNAPVAKGKSVTTSPTKAVAATLSGTDPDADPLTYAVVSQPTQGTLSGTAPDLTYTPSPTASGTDSFTFQVSDGITNSTATMTIVVSAPGVYTTVQPLYALSANGPWLTTNAWPALTVTNPVGNHFYSIQVAGGVARPVEGPTPTGPWSANSLWPTLNQPNGFYRMAITSVVR